MTSTRHESTSETLRADTGASMISVDMSDEAAATLIKGVVEAGILHQVDPTLLSRTPLRPEGGSWKHFASASGGLNSALKFLMEQANITTRFEHRVASIDLQGALWKVRPYEGTPATFDAVVIAVEACGDGTDHVHQIRGGWQRLIDPESERHLRQEMYDHRFGVALFLKPEYTQHCDAFFGPVALEKQIDDDMIHLMQYQTRKTVAIGGLQSGSPVLVAHTTLEYSNRDLGFGKNRRLELISNRIIYQYLQVPARVKLKEVVLDSKVINWRTCEVKKPLVRRSVSYPSCLPLSQNPPLVLAGDYFTQSNFTGCATSARDAAAAVFAALQSELTIGQSGAAVGATMPAHDMSIAGALTVSTGTDSRTSAEPPSRRWIAKRSSDTDGVEETVSEEVVVDGATDGQEGSSRAQRRGRWRDSGGGKGAKGRSYKGY
eukprot:gnl/TRDRNA2_/TRDRNA2_62517_c0_seq1.p1 gnl/TRDRNA2_/TRDRNA2_62517_c0~~gnl/TRDRNA2_/TRDRNA2_62517_c0_seq1.p1  ORF type:complete len:461 (+),score=47.17 gnl/TRDRNA2_/TRDRNA2_62517_c0_seq1:86-1384(+)